MSSDSFVQVSLLRYLYADLVWLSSTLSAEFFIIAFLPSFLVLVEVYNYAWQSLDAF